MGARTVMACSEARIALTNSAPEVIALELPVEVPAVVVIWNFPFAQE
jgi:hypothetical protein